MLVQLELGFDGVLLVSVLALVLVLSDFGAESLPELLLGDDLAPESDSASCFLLPVLKSVSYQPPPLSRKLAAETSFFNVGLWHSGHSTRGASLIFCKASNVALQLVH